MLRLSTKKKACFSAGSVNVEIISVRGATTSVAAGIEDVYLRLNPRSNTNNPPKINATGQSMPSISVAEARISPPMNKSPKAGQSAH